MNPYEPPAEGAEEGIARGSEPWSISTRLKVFFGFVFTSLFLTFGFFHTFFVLSWGDAKPLGTEIAHRFIITSIGIGLPLQCLFSAIAFNRKMVFAMIVCNCVVLALQLYCVNELIKAVVAGPNVR